MANVDVRLGNKSAAWFTANPTLVLGDGQHVYLNDNSGQYKKGDGSTQLQNLPFIGGTPATPTLQQVLTAGSTLTQNNAISGNFNLNFNSLAEFTAAILNGSFVDIHQTYVEISGGALGSNRFYVDGSEARVENDVIIKLTAPNVQVTNETASKVLYLDASKNIKSASFGVNDVLLTTSIPFVFPESYGAAGDGVTDDTTAIQNAINSGSPVFFSKKTYLVTGLTLTSNVKLFGCGKSSVLKTTTNAPIITITGDYNNIENLSFLGNSTGASQHGISAIGNAGLTLYRIQNMVRNCYGVTLGGALIYTQYMVGNPASHHQGAFVVSDCVAISCSVGFYCDERGEYNSFSNCSAYSCTSGYRIHGGNNNFVGGKVTECTNGVYLGSGANDAHSVISACSINHNTNAVYSDGVTRSYLFNGCMIYVGAIQILNSTGIKFNSCDFSTIGTLSVTNSTYTEFSNCKFINNPTFTITGTWPTFFKTTWLAGSPSALILDNCGDVKDISATSTVTGWSSFTLKSIKYTVQGKTAFVEFDINGTSNATTISFTLPFTNNSTAKVASVYAINNGTVVSGGGVVQCSGSSSTVNAYMTWSLGAGTAWTGSGSKRIIGTITLEVD